MKNTRAILKNILYAFGAQGLSLILSILVSMFLPKVLGIESYGYWQLFIFYSSYAGLFHFGLNDGLYLKIGGKEYNSLDYPLLNADLIIATVSQSFLAIIAVTVWVFWCSSDANRSFIIICTAIYVVICNYSGYLTYVLQTTNRIKEYSMTVVIDKLGFMIVVIGGLYLQIENFSFFVALYLCSKATSTIYAMIKTKEVIKAKPCDFSIALREVVDNIHIGINLTLSSIASMLVLGGGRMIIDKKWGVLAFGKFSLALSLSNFFLQFISQVSLVLFPALRRCSDDKVKEIYDLLRRALGIILSAVLLGYMPIYYILSAWLPQYSESLRYLALLLPLCTYDGKMNMLCNTYLKVLRKEKVLLRINIISFCTSFVLCFLSSYVIDDIYFVVISMVISIAVRSIISELYLSKLMGTSVWLSIIQESVLVTIFVVSTWNLGAGYGFIIYLITYVAYLAMNHKSIRMLYYSIRRNF